MRTRTQNNSPVSPAAFHLLAKPVGAACNLTCRYCFYLSKKKLYRGSRFVMTDRVLKAYVRQYIDSQQTPEVTFAWQGGEPTLIGLDFYQRAAAYVVKFRKPGMKVQWTIQTNGTLLNDEWCAFFRKHRYLVGISIDGPCELHDAYRVDRAGRPTFEKVMRGVSLLQRHRVDFNVLACIHSANGDYPLEVYRFFRDEVGAEFIQFIPVVQPDESDCREGNRASSTSVGAEQYGRFLNLVFDEWVRRDVGKVFVQLFDASLAAWVGASPGLCVFSPTCGGALVLEHNGDLFSCDHFVEPEHLLGNILDRSMIELAGSEKQRTFGLDKLDKLPQSCRECEVLFACHGGCPKDRLARTAGGETGLNYLCAGYKAFFRHVDLPMRKMAALLRRNLPAADIMSELDGAPPAGRQ